MSDPNAMDVDTSSSSNSLAPAANLVEEFQREGQSQSIDSQGQTASPALGNSAVMDVDTSSNGFALGQLNGEASSGGLTGLSSSSSSVPPNGQAIISLTDSSAGASNGAATLFALGNNGVAATGGAVVARKVPRTGYVYDPLMMMHCQDGYIPTADNVQDAGNGHPEEPMRIKRIFNLLKSNGLIKKMKQLPSIECTYDQVRLVHDEDHWLKVQGTELLTDEYIVESKGYYDNLSLYVCRETAHCARLSCGGVISACTAVCTGEVRNAFAIVRPPGHHAEPDEHMGFCFYNNVAVAAREMQQKGLAKKVLILDWDVHHGNGTQRAFWDDPSVLYMSIHRHDGGRFYPGSDFGALDMVGVGAGEGYCVNIPWPFGGFGDGDYIYAFQKIIMPIAYEFAPDLVIISAGFDAADGDQLGECKVSPAGYGHMTHMLSALAKGKLVVALEGGYNLKAIADSSLAVGRVLLGETPDDIGEVEASEAGTEVVLQAAKVQSKYWKNVTVKSCEKPEVTTLANGAQATTGIPDILKIYRAHHLFSQYGLFEIPLASEELNDAFASQVICTEGIFSPDSSKVLVVFAHDFGNLRVETDGVTTTDINLAKSYLIDTTDLIVDWATKQNNYNLIDVNVLKRLPTTFVRDKPKMVSNSGDKLEGKLMRYLWDNYIELTDATDIIFIGHGSACGALMELVNHRDVEHKVRAVVQVGGLHSFVRPDPANESKRAWFRQASRIYVPDVHPLLQEERLHRRLGGQIFTSPKSPVVAVLNDVFPQIQEFVASKLPEPASSSNGNGIVVDAQTAITA
ncbi:Histone deacetylase clr3 [Vanrija pseudolonga]|uniref:histone deacetylase n=1 Tax=Vanrija pseudolonga TaxID=143232 RepID=A0AAF0YCH1_9TREE|nr:Histone deacetylase clr3 [Vanrija pseudolonga]